ncbi:YciI family protein [Rufibacter sp. LB8]|uniref:YciI family protein n=1 Tax=Rufibacter sp. LB8 TaxID=2777781 RepID=UPI00178C2FBF|nr:YciI family protein [Rufibacter sp. LB8]
MKQYLITGLDYTTPGALDHRMAVRPFHFEAIKKYKDSGNFILGGAMLNDEGNMIGSTLVMQFASDEALQQWMDQEPYILEKVWESVTVTQFKVAQV